MDKAGLKGKFGAAFWSYGWGSRMVEQIMGMIPNLKVELLDPVVAKGLPSEEVFKALDRLFDIN